jgi:hypothetical protein
MSETQSTNAIALLKGEERYIFLYTDDCAGKTIEMAGQFAHRPELSFDWNDAYELSKRVNEVTK